MADVVKAAIKDTRLKSKIAVSETELDQTTFESTIYTL